MNLGHWLAVLRARWVVVAVVFVLVTAAATVVALRQPKQYAATAVLLFEARPDPVSTMLYGGGPSMAQINTQLEVMRSDRVAQRVAEQLKLADDPEVQARWRSATSERQPFEGWVVEFLRKGLSVAVQPGSSVVNVTYTGGTGEQAAAVANAFVQAYLQAAVDLRVEPAKQYNAFFSQQVKESRDALESAQSALAKFQRDHGILIAEGKDLDEVRLDQLTEEAVTLPSGGGGRLADGQGSAAVTAARAELSRAEAKAAELSRRFGENHPQVQDGRAAVVEARNQLAAETARARGQATARAQASAGRAAQVNAAIEQQREKLLKLKEVRDQATVLVRDVDSAQKAYDAVLARYNQTSLESQNRQSNATIISEASPPAWPSSPRRITTLLIGMLGALMAGVVAALGWEQLDRRVRTVGDLSATMGLPVIGIMPSPIAGRSDQRWLAVKQKWMISGRQLPAPANDAN
ncbi:MAG: chain length determinant protein EpsF [Proteobacteria bacterium]|nr:chain length determinant protein EpsF [Pseudomonadota bacterium]